MHIEFLGSPVLRQKASEVIEIDDELRLVIADMFATMYGAEGIGLAGNQVGILKRVIVVDVPQEPPSPFALVNPHIVERGSELEKAEEGCLSVPGVSALVERPATVVVEGMDAEGHGVRIEAAGLLARCLQHEIDHLDGILFIDRLAALKRSMLLKKYRSLAAEEEEAATREKVAERRSG